MRGQYLILEKTVLTFFKIFIGYLGWFKGDKSQYKHSYEMGTGDDLGHFFLKFLIFKLKFIMFITNTNTTENLFITVVGHNYHPLYIDDNITRLKL